MAAIELDSPPDKRCAVGRSLDYRAVNDHISAAVAAATASSAAVTAATASATAAAGEERPQEEHQGEERKRLRHRIQVSHSRANPFVETRDRVFRAYHTRWDFSRG